MTPPALPGHNTTIVSRGCIALTEGLTSYTTADIVLRDKTDRVSDHRP